MSGKRLNYIDFGKAIAIVFVVATHLGFSFMEKNILFAMPLFFAAAGLTYKVGKYRFGDYAKNRFKRLIVPFWIGMAVYALLEIIRSGYYGYGNPSVALSAVVNGVYGSARIPQIGRVGEILLKIMSYKQQTAGIVDLILPTDCHLWFLPAMFCATVLYYPIAEFKGKHKIAVKIGSAAVLLLLAGIETIPGMFQFPYGFGRGCFGAACMIFGGFLRDTEILESKKPSVIAATVIAGLGLTAGAYFLGSDGSSIVRSVYGPYPFASVFVTYLGGIGALTLVFQLCRLLDKIPVKGIKTVISTVGENSMTVYLWHFIVITFADILFLEISKTPVNPDIFYMVTVSADYWLYKVILLVAVIVFLAFFGKLAHEIKVQKQNRPT